MTYTITVTQRGRTHETYARTRPEADEVYGRFLAANPSAEVKLMQDGAGVLASAGATR